MNTNLYLCHQQSFAEHEEQTAKLFKEHAEQFGGDYFYAYAYGALKAAYIHLYNDYEKLKAEYDKEKAAIESSHLNLV